MLKPFALKIFFMTKLGLVDLVEIILGWKFLGAVKMLCQINKLCQILIKSLKKLKNNDQCKYPLKLKV